MSTSTAPHRPVRLLTLPPWVGMLTMLLAALMLSANALAANPKDWWVDIANDRANEVKTMLARGADPNEISPAGQPAIMQAIRDGAWDVYEVLARHPKTVLNAININRETPLMYLAVVGETARAQALIRRGALVNRLGWTPLHYAASKGHLDTVKMLVANKAIVNAPGPDGTTPLMMGAYGGSQEVVQYLLDVGADATMVNLNKWDAARWARARNHDGLAEKLDNLAARVKAHRGATGVAAPPNSLDDSAAGSADRKKSGTENQSRSNQGSPSRYFDLERFNEDTRP